MPTSIDPVTFAELRDTTGSEFVPELIDTFLQEAPAMLAELRDTLARGDAERFRRAAHSLKSNSQTFGALRLGEMARALELGGLVSDGTRIDALQAEYERAAAALQERCRG